MTEAAAPRPWIKSYAANVPDDIELPTGSLSDLIASSVAEFGDHVALEFFGRETSYAELGEQIDQAAEGLRRLGLRKGAWLRGYAYAFIETFVPTLTREVVEQAVRQGVEPE